MIKNDFDIVKQIINIIYIGLAKKIILFIVWWS